MNDIGMLLRDQLGDGGPPSQISITEAIGHGRRTVRRRRAVTSVAVGLTVALVATSVAWATRSGHPVPGGTVPPSATASVPSYYGPSLPEPTASGPSRPGPGAGNVPVYLNLGTLGEPAQVLEGGTVVASLSARPTSAVDDVARVPDGWVFLEEPAHGNETVWFQPTGSTARRVTDVVGDFRVSDDGTVLVVAGVRPGRAGEVVAYSLPSLAELRRTTYTPPRGPVVKDVRGDWALLTGVPGWAAVPAELWNVSTGQTIPFADQVNTWPLDVAPDGSVLRRVDRIQPNDSVTQTVTSCFDVVTPGATVPTGFTGYCYTAPNDSEASGTLSPTGQWAALDMGPYNGFLEVVRSADLHAGHWAPTRVAFYGSVEFWDSDTTFIVRADRYERCDVTGGCTPLDVPDNAFPRCIKNFGQLFGC